MDNQDNQDFTSIIGYNAMRSGNQDIWLGNQSGIGGKNAWKFDVSSLHVTSSKLFMYLYEIFNAEQRKSQICTLLLLKIAS